MLRHSREQRVPDSPLGGGGGGVLFGKGGGGGEGERQNNLTS